MIRFHSVYYLVMEETEQRLKRERQREARRKRILSNASSRMDKLRGFSKRYRSQIRSNPGGTLISAHRSLAALQVCRRRG